MTSSHSEASTSKSVRNAASTPTPTPPKHTLADLFHFQEIFLRVLSFLPVSDLARIQAVNSHFAKMSLDPQLWKGLYLARYPHPHHSRLIYVDAPKTPSKRPIARLPSRAFPPPSPSRSPSVQSMGPPASASSASTHQIERYPGVGQAKSLTNRETVDVDGIGHGVRNDGLDWKMMMRLNTNWSNGNVSAEADIPLPPSPSPSATSEIVPPPPRPQSAPYNPQHIALCPSFIFTCNPASPLVNVYRSSTSFSATTTAAPIGIIPPPPGWSSPTRPDNVTAICADESVAPAEEDESALPARIAIFYQSGGFVVLSVRHSFPTARLNWKRESIHPPQQRPRSVRRRATTFTPLEGDPVVLATMHYPLLLTGTLDFHLSFYALLPPIANEPTRPLHVSTMHSDVSFHPATLSVFPHTPESLNGPVNEERPQNFRASLTYCTPLYPSSWTVAVQEFGIDLPSSLSKTPLVWRGECWHVGRNSISMDPFIWPKKVDPVIGIKGRRAVGVGSDGRWAVLAGNDNQIQVYSLPTPSPSPPPSTKERPPEPIRHAQTLLAHSSSVTSLSLVGGRCVSGGQDGRVLVWELDAEEDEARVGRTIGYVEVRRGGRKTWKGASGPSLTSTLAEDQEGLPHPASISAAARSLFLPRPPMEDNEERRPAIRRLAFDEQKIVGLVRMGEGNEMMKVWSFDA
ncbi:hypothetical protein M231_07324 [Tremella mesenterica]|uniref:F-box domain-containing protein n=1 Tax=Tremella mesenterica TaxID=5217 RepID=A0A4V1M328_TREME|nr:uncharacterized protein TREMEDRAFT_27000 [Tremella mesenterica DSM 1558]EIW71674.1 hypothetical protein TREMEDRAFT_27000 [Tremella mesenterica DSM 1558]RXK35420.1 hypothetical protein M231_07324 [Tremella mesenterica]